MQSETQGNNSKMFLETEKYAYSAVLSVHYITLALYALAALGGAVLLIVFTLTTMSGNAGTLWAASIISPILFVLHLLAVKGLKNQKQWGYDLSKNLSYLLLLAFPIGTVLGVILLSQLSKFKIPN